MATSYFLRNSQENLKSLCPLVILYHRASEMPDWLAQAKDTVSLGDLAKEKLKEKSDPYFNLALTLLCSHFGV